MGLFSSDIESNTNPVTREYKRQIEYWKNKYLYKFQPYKEEQEYKKLIWKIYWRRE